MDDKMTVGGRVGLHVYMLLVHIQYVPLNYMSNEDDSYSPSCLALPLNWKKLN